jgi:prolyl oligopeptidase
VNPKHSRKMTARLQAATASGLPILLRTTATAGHGMGSSLSDRVSEQTDIYAFLFNELGMDTSAWTF